MKIKIAQQDKIGWDMKSACIETDRLLEISENMHKEIFSAIIW